MQVILLKNVERKHAEEIVAGFERTYPESKGDIIISDYVGGKFCLTMDNLGDNNSMICKFIFSGFISGYVTRATESKPDFRPE